MCAGSDFDQATAEKLEAGGMGEGKKSARKRQNGMKSYGKKDAQGNMMSDTSIAISPDSPGVLLDRDHVIAFFGA